MHRALSCRACQYQAHKDQVSMSTTLANVHVSTEPVYYDTTGTDIQCPDQVIQFDQGGWRLVSY